MAGGMGREPLAVGAEGGVARTFDGQILDVPALAGLPVRRPQAHALAATIPKPAAGGDPLSVRAHRAKAYVVLRFKHHAPPGTLSIPHNSAIALCEGPNPAVGTGVCAPRGRQPPRR